MQGPGGGGGRRLPPVRQGSGASSGSQRRASILSGIYANRAASCRSQSMTSDGKAVDRGSLVGNKYAIRVFDDEGKDVTPHPLFHSDPNTVVPRQGKLLASSAYFGATGSGFLSSFSVHQTLGVNATLGSFSRVAIIRDYPRDVQVRREEIKEELTKEDLDRRVDIYLTETETIWILDMPSVVVSVESEDASRVLERNRIYVDVCKNRPGNDRFVEKMMQTINGAAKNKEVQCDKIIMEDKDPDVTSDTSSTIEAVKEAKREKHDREKQDKEEQKEAFIDPSVLSDLNKTPEEIVPPRLERLWSYICDLTNGHSVSSMAWSKVNPWPERIFQCEHGVTALDFSTASPNLLAVGMYNGSIAIYNVRNCKDTVLLDSSLNPVVSCFASPRGKFTSVLFAQSTDCLLVGDTKGEVSVFELRNLAAPSSKKVDPLRDIIGPAAAI
ncbi:dynein axonemal intermediate chain 4 [Grus japonensis]|uniref:Dynein axonemal intermediate chain 4 n=1 Tax=Grus japonensis TaxID=30415 RepID=A0ABC9X750_GRUJA